MRGKPQGREADGEEGVAMVGECVCVSWRVLCEVHSCPAEWNSFSLSLFFPFSHIFIPSLANSLHHLVPPLSFMLYNSLSHHIPPVLPVMALCLWCHSGQNSQARLECDTDWKGNGERQNGWERVKYREKLRGKMLKAMKVSTRWMTWDRQMICILEWNSKCVQISSVCNVLHYSHPPLQQEIDIKLG